MIDHVYFYDFPGFLQRLQTEGKLIHFPFLLRRTMEERHRYFHPKAQSENKAPRKLCDFAFLASLREIKYSVVAAKNYGRKMLILELQQRVSIVIPY